MILKQIICKQPHGQVRFAKCTYRFMDSFPCQKQEKFNIRPPECQFFKFTSMKLDISIFMHDILGKFSIGHIGNLDFEAWDFFLFNPLTPVFKKIQFLSTGIQNTIRPF